MDKNQKEKNQIFRTSSLEKINAPDALDKYIRVSNPGIWMVLAAIILLLLGGAAWSIFGRLETLVDAAVVVKNGNAVCYYREDHSEHVKDGMVVKVEDKDFTITSISQKPIQADDQTDEYAKHLISVDDGDWICTAKVDTDLKDGSYEAKIVEESISPMSFIFN